MRFCFCFRDSGSSFSLNRASTRLVLVAALFLAAGSSSPASAQSDPEPILRKGDAVVTGYSGVALLKPAKGADPVDFAVINQQGASVQIFDLSELSGSADAR